ncbi:hypothetical protein ElyMa_000278600 [Elysia marginata]|uniref:Secreted protein n=1 Tax=Elysia marginata TaxID=1093978 RepID=A0AAV4F4Y7_9GAST|nr:hypothetical protein ElyMa_000278600 [Elysia marginata]
MIKKMMILMMLMMIEIHCVWTTVMYDVTKTLGSLAFTADDWPSGSVMVILDFVLSGLRSPELAHNARSPVSLVRPRSEIFTGKERRGSFHQSR